jgi:ferredoxin
VNAKHRQLQQDLAIVLSASGLSVLGWFAMFKGPDRLQGKTAVLIGNRGGAMWQAYQTSEIAQEGVDNALDRWTNTVIAPIARANKAAAFYPFLNEENPDIHWPFQQWARAAIGLQQSPLGLLIDPQYGLWQAFRAVLVFDEVVDLPVLQDGDHPCDQCKDKPCLTICPVDAVTLSGFDVAGCRKHLASPAGSPCINKGCIARNACPVGLEFAYGDEQQAFHMRALGVKS